jgi:hypothetical protein
MIAVECYADELLILKMGFPRKSIKHARGKGRVLNKIKNCPGAIGVVDEDPGMGQPDELKQYKTIQRKGSITLLGKRSGDSIFVIQISPRLEEWLLKRANINNIKPEDFSLSNKAEVLHGIKKPRDNKKYNAFLVSVIDADQEIKVMKEWIKEKLELTIL